MYSDAVGDVPTGSIGGLVHADTRFLSRWALTVNGAPLLALRAGHRRPLLGGVLPDQPAARRARGEQRRRAPAALRRQRPARADRGLELRSTSRSGSSSAWRSATTSPTCSRSRTGSATAPTQITRIARRGRLRADLPLRERDLLGRDAVEVSPPATRVDGDDLVWDLDLPTARDAGLRAARAAQARAERVQPTHAGFGEVFAVRGRRRGQRAGSPQLPGWRPTPTCSTRSSTRPRATWSPSGSRPSRRRRRGRAAGRRPALVPDRSSGATRSSPPTRRSPSDRRLARGALLALAPFQGNDERRLQGRGAGQDPARDPAWAS